MSNIKYLIFGRGYIGTRFSSFLDNSIISTKRINSTGDVVEEIKKYDPEIVINCIGRTGTPHIDWCEDHKIETIKGNIIVPLFILEACQILGKYMVSMASGCIYEGDNDGKGFSEDDKPNFFGSFYSRTKLYSEKLLKEFDNVLQIRIRIPMDDYPHPKNIINKITTYKKIINVKNSITYIPDMLQIAEKLMHLKKTGIYNVVNKGYITYPEILELYKQIINPSFKYTVISLDEFHKIVKALRSNCILSVDKLERENIRVRPIREAVIDCLNKYKKNLKTDV